MSRSSVIARAGLILPIALAACASAAGDEDPSAPVSQERDGLQGTGGAPMPDEPPAMDDALANAGTSGMPSSGPPRQIAVVDPVDVVEPAPDAGPPVVVEPPEPLEPLPADLGTYRGSTDQGGTFSFVLEEIGITRIAFEWEVTGCSGLSGSDVPDPPRPVQGEFELETRGGPGGVTATFTGRFDSRTTALGTASYRVIPSMGSSACAGTAATTWTAALSP